MQRNRGWPLDSGLVLCGESGEDRRIEFRCCQELARDGRHDSVRGASSSPTPPPMFPAPSTSTPITTKSSIRTPTTTPSGSIALLRRGRTPGNYAILLRPRLRASAERRRQPLRRQRSGLFDRNIGPSGRLLHGPQQSQPLREDLSQITSFEELKRPC
jgi:hypothetical protein